ncbi:MAG: hypothetical protein HJJLKODD_02164 [Phycisphaerae bacterium]|nr:hypothetical protein [Phycisphaerae bacterium]
MNIDFVALVSRWLHIAAVIIAVGGTVVWRFVILPSVKEVLSDEQHERLRSAMLARWRMWVHVAIGLILVSGLYNTYRALFQLGKPTLYHALWGVKFLAALVIFFLAEALVGGSPALARFREQRSRWLSVMLIFAVLVVLISGVLKFIPDQPKVTGI